MTLFHFIALFISIAFVIFLFFISLNSAKIRGAFGEFKVKSILNTLGSNYEILNDVLIQTSNGNTSQIDHVVLSEYGIFVIETKNYKGWIFGREKAGDWTQVIYKRRNSFGNPVKHNWAHVYALENVLADFPKVKYYPIVVFVGSATLKNIESSVPVVYSCMLKMTIKRISVEKCILKDDLIKIRALLESVQLNDKGSKKVHVQSVKQNVIEKKVKIENLICPRCNGTLKLRNGKYGSFYGCSNYPNCKFTMSY